MLNIDLSGKVALVTGASRGIGYATACKIVQAGGSVVINARTIDNDLIKSIENIRADSVLAVEGSVSDPNFASSLIKNIHAKHKRLDVLVNNAGIMKPSLIGMIPTDDVDELLKVNLYSVIYLTQSASRLMERSGNGSIINLTSIVGQRGESGQFVYAASKAGVIGATLSAAKELASKNIRVNAIAPGYIATKMTEDLGDDVKQKTIESIALKRPGEPEDIANTVAFLASDMAKYITGQIIGVNGGMVL